MKLTISTNIQRQSVARAGGLLKHDEHDPERDHSNKTIVPDEYGTIKLMEPVLKETVEKIYQPYIRERNKHAVERYNNHEISADQFAAAHTTLTDWLYDGRKRSKSAKEGKPVVTSLVIKIGNLHDLPALYDRLGLAYEIRTDWPGLNGQPKAVLLNDEDKAKWADYMRDVFSQVLREYQDHDGFAPYKAAIHLDEGGAPHMHLGLVNAGVTAKGKPSTTLNNAIKSYLKSANLPTAKDYRTNMASWREAVDSVVTQALTKTNERWGVNEVDTLTRLDPLQRGVPQEIYKNIQTAEHQHQQAVKERDKAEGEVTALTHHKARLKAETDTLKGEVDTLTDTRDSLKGEIDTYQGQAEIHKRDMAQWADDEAQYKAMRAKHDREIKRGAAIDAQYRKMYNTNALVGRDVGPRVAEWLHTLDGGSRDATYQQRQSDLSRALMAWCRGHIDTQTLGERLTKIAAKKLGDLLVDHNDPTPPTRHHDQSGPEL